MYGSSTLHQLNRTIVLRTHCQRELSKLEKNFRKFELVLVYVVLLYLDIVLSLKLENDLVGTPNKLLKGNFNFLKN
jgi:hypothetical protein